MEWVKVKSRIPDTLQASLHVLTYSPNNGFVSTSYFRPSKNDFIDDVGFNGEVDKTITHWAYMPEKP